MECLECLELELARHRLDYQKDSSVFFAPLAHLPGAIWLNSTNHQEGRDMLSALPQQQWTQWPQHAQLRQQHSPPRLIACTPLTALPLIIDQQQQFYGELNASFESSSLDYSSPEASLLAPGLMGFFSYNFGLAAHDCPNKTDDIDFPLADIGFYTWHIVVNHHQQQAYLYYYPQHHNLKDLLALLQQTPLQIHPLQLTGTFTSNLSAKEYQSAFNVIQQHLINGDVYQVNFAQRFHCTAQGSAWPTYQQLRLQHPHPYAGYLNSQHGEILCFSPEEFLRIDREKKISTQPIKGTQPRHTDAIEDQRLALQLSNSEKDRAENIMIVDLLRNDLGQVCETGSVHVDALCQLHSFASVHHLISSVHGQLRDNIHPLMAFAACFPGGSITGAPKRQAIRIIQQLEKNQRHIFCGSLFALTADHQLLSNICIRTFLYQAPNLYCWAGGGIVIDSAWQNEYAEASWKIKQLLNDVAKINP